MSTDIQVVEKQVLSLSNEFEQIAHTHNAVTFAQEANFAMQAFRDNSFLLSTAQKNPASLKDAIVNIAAIGLTLNPAHKFAYLVPRIGKICLDISYIGLVKLACDVGALKWVQAEVVRESDTFTYNGVGNLPDHKMDPFMDRGDLKGAYCVAKTEDGEFLTTVMGINEIYAIRDRTEAWKAYKSGKIKTCPWVSDEGEMIKKTVIKRAYKLWPKNNKFERLNVAIDTLNSSEGINFKEEQKIALASPEQVSNIRHLLGELQRDEKNFLEHYSVVFKRDIQSLEDLNEKEANQAQIQLMQFLTQAK